MTSCDFICHVLRKAKPHTERAASLGNGGLFFPPGVHPDPMLRVPADHGLIHVGTTLGIYLGICVGIFSLLEGEWGLAFNGIGVVIVKADKQGHHGNIMLRGEHGRNHSRVGRFSKKINEHPFPLVVKVKKHALNAPVTQSLNNRFK